MSLFENTYRSQVEQMGRDWVTVWDRIAYLIQRDGGRIYKSESYARAYFSAMGAKAEATCVLSAAAIEFLQATAGIVGRTAPDALPPAGYTLTADSAGNVVPTYHDPDSSSSSSSSQSSGV